MHAPFAQSHQLANLLQADCESVITSGLSSASTSPKPSTPPHFDEVPEAAARLSLGGTRSVDCGRLSHGYPFGCCRPGFSPDSRSHGSNRDPGALGRRAALRVNVHRIARSCLHPPCSNRRPRLRCFAVLLQLLGRYQVGDRASLKRRRRRQRGHYHERTERPVDFACRLNEDAFRVWARVNHHLHRCSARQFCTCLFCSNAGSLHIPL